MCEKRVAMTRDIFNRHLRHKKRNHHDFAENGRVLMKKLEDLEIPKDVRVCTHGFVIPELDHPTQREVLKLLTPRRWTASINHITKVTIGEKTSASYVHIILTTS